MGVGVIRPSSRRLDSRHSGARHRLPQPRPYASNPESRGDKRLLDSGFARRRAPRNDDGGSYSQLTCPVVMSCIAAAIFNSPESTIALMMRLRFGRLAAVSRALASATFCT